MSTRSAGDDPAMAHCHSMVPPGPNSAAVQTCAAGSHSLCVIDLQADNQAKTARLPAAHAETHPDALPPLLNLASFTPFCPSLRSSIGDSPLITPLRL